MTNFPYAAEADFDISVEELEVYSIYLMYSS